MGLPRLQEFLTLPPGTVVDLTAYRNCSLPYIVTEVGTCESIQDMFGLTALFRPDSPNPDLDCSNLQPFQQICIKRGNLPYTLPCVKSYEVKPEDTCSSIIANMMDPDVDQLANTIKFYTLNVGIYCSRIDSSFTFMTGYNDEVCLEAGNLDSHLENCKAKPMKMLKYSNCASLKKCFKKPDTFKKLNKNVCMAGFLRSLKKKSNPHICVSKSGPC